MDEIIDKTISAWYELDVNEDSLLVLAPNKIAEYVRKKIKLPNSHIESMQKELRIPKFILPTNYSWGFGKAIETEHKNGWTIWKCPLKNKFSSISASLQLLFLALNTNSIVTESEFPQFITVETSLSFDDIGGAGITATLSSYVCRWLGRQPDNSENEEIINAMKQAFKIMRGRISWSDRFGAHIRHPKWIDLSIPDDRCELYSEKYNSRSEEGYRLFPHNVDEPTQQLTLVAGLAKLYQLVKQNFLHQNPLSS